MPEEVYRFIEENTEILEPIDQDEDFLIDDDYIEDYQ